MRAIQTSGALLSPLRTLYLLIFGILFFIPPNIFGEEGYIPLLAVILVVITAARRTLVIDLYVFLLFATAVLYVVLSHFHFFPRIMRFYVDDLINRQAGQYIVLLMLSLIFFPITEDLKAGLFDWRHYTFLLVGSYVSYILFYYAFALNVADAPEDLSNVYGFTFYGFTLYGFTAPVMLCQLAWLLLIENCIRSKSIKVAAILAQFAIFDAQTNQLVTVFSIIMVLLNGPIQLVKFAFLTSLTALLVCLVVFDSSSWTFIKNVDLDAWVRVEMWHTALNNFLASHLLGVGFGTEYRFAQNSFNSTNFLFTHEDQIFVAANHNSFIDQFFRLGLLGGVLFILMFLNCLKGKRHHFISKVFEGELFLLIFFGALLNPMIESIKGLVALVFIYCLIAAEGSRVNVALMPTIRRRLRIVAR